jgi:hypothetical protein
MKKAHHFIGVVCLYLISINANSQTTLDDLTKLLQQTTEATFKKDYATIIQYLDQLPPKEAISTSQKLIEIAAELPQYKMVFQPIMETGLEAYARRGIKRNSILYCISLIDQPKFKKTEIQQSLLYNIGSIHYTFK